MQINERGLELIKRFEGCKLRAYQDVVGVWTIGWGCTGDDIEEGLEISQEEADEMLEEDLIHFEDAITDLLEGTPVNENQFAALVCFAYNCGLENLKSSTLLKKVNAKNWKGAAAEFLKWDHAGGLVFAGLTRRRQAESALFLTS